MSDLVKINATDYGLEESKASEIKAMFTPMLAKMEELEGEYNSIITQEITPELCEAAATLRKKFVKVRTGTADIHKELKAFYLKGGRFVDAFKNIQEQASGEKEKTLKNIEDHFEIIERERKEKLRNERAEMISPYVEDVNTFMLGEMTQEAFDLLLKGAKDQYEAKLAAIKKAEEDRIEAERKAAEEREAQRLENIRLKEEAAERERLAEIERKKQADILAKQKAEADKKERELRAKAEAERKERERLESELKAKKEAEEKAEKQRIAEEKKALRAPDKDKIIALSEVIGKIELPEVKSDEAKEIIRDAKQSLQRIIVYLTQKAEAL